MLQKQQTVAEATADITAVVRTFSGNMAKENEQKKAQAEKAYEDRLKEQNDGSYERFIAQDANSRHLQMLANDSAYAAADSASREWGIGGSNSRLLNAATTLITGTLGGQTDLQVAANTLAPYASAGIGRSVGHGENKNEAAQAVGHFVLGATLAYINGGDPLSGGSAAAAAEATAQYLARQYDDGKTARDPISGEFEPNLLPESVKEEIRATTGAIAAVVGATGDGGAALNAQISGVIGQNAMENNDFGYYDGTNTGELVLRGYAESLYPKDDLKADQFVREYKKYQLTAMLKAGKDIAVGTLDSIRHPIDSAVSLYEAVTNPKQTYKNIVLSAQEWNTLYSNALNNDIPLAARMYAEMNATVGLNATTFVVSGGTASLIQKSLQSGRLAKTVQYVKTVTKSTPNNTRAVSNTPTTLGKGDSHVTTVTSRTPSGPNQEAVRVGYKFDIASGTHIGPNGSRLSDTGYKDSSGRTIFQRESGGYLVVDLLTSRQISVASPYQKNSSVVSSLYRPNLRVGTQQAIYGRYTKLPNGNYMDKDGNIIKKPIDVGHEYGWENRRLLRAAEELGMSQKQLNDYVNARPNRFRLEYRPDNSAHKNEKPGNGDLREIKDDMTNFLRKGK